MVHLSSIYMKKKGSRTERKRGEEVSEERRSNRSCSNREAMRMADACADIGADVEKESKIS